MAFEQLALEIGVGIGLGTLISIMAFLASKDKWNNRLFGYTLVLGVITTFGVIEGIEGGVDETNILKVILEVAGLSFLANKGIKMADRIRAGAK